MTDTKNCRGCRDDFYNQNDCGLNMTPDGPRCWMLADAVFTKNVEVHVDERPPWTGTPARRLACFKRDRHVYVPADHPNVESKPRGGMSQ